MKKLFSLGLIGWLLVSLAACQAPSSDELDATDTQIQTLQNRVDQLENENTQLKDELAGYQAVEGTVTFVLDTTPPVIRSLSYDDAAMATPLDLLIEALGDDQVITTESEFGIFIESIGSINPLYGSYIMIEKNNEPLSVGLADAPYNDGDIFRFSLEYWDANAFQVRTSIERFIAQEAESFIDEFNYDVLTGLSILNEPLPDAYALQGTGEAGYLKDILVQKALGEVAPSAIENYQATFAMTPLFRGSLGMMALSDTAAYEALIDDYLAHLETVELNTVGFDDLAMTIMHLKDATPPRIIDAYETQVPSLDNAPSLALAIMAEIALSSNPYDTVLETGDTLPDALMNLQTIKGGFLYDYASGPASTRQFSSPQSFLALTVLEAYLNGDSTMPYE